MAPELGVSIVALNLYFKGRELVGDGERIKVPADLTWYSTEQPKNSYSLLDGVAYIYQSSESSEIESQQIRQARLGRGPRYLWRDNAQGEGLAFILVLPHDYTLIDSDPMPTEAK